MTLTEMTLDQLWQAEIKTTKSARHYNARHDQARVSAFMAEGMEISQEIQRRSETRIARERGENSGMIDARRYDIDSQNFDPTDNPYGVDSQSAEHELWAEGYENTFEATKTKL